MVFSPQKNEENTINNNFEKDIFKLFVFLIIIFDSF